MNSFFTIILIGISLSMDAFSLALIYGMNGIKKRKIFLLSLFVGIFHFFMPIIGMIVSNLVVSKFVINLSYLISFIFLVIGIEMIISSYRLKEFDLLDNIGNYFLFSFSVSIDSFTVGLGMIAISSNYIFVSFVFMICSFIFTYIGLFFGNRLNNKLGNISTIIGGIVLLLLSFYYLFKI